MRRIFAIVLIVLGLGTAGAAIASGTIWRPDDRVTLTLPTTPDVPLVITAPGVLTAVDTEVDVRLVGAAADTPIVLAMGRESDVLAWVGDAPHWQITGLTDWETLTYVDSRTGESSDATAEASDSAEATAGTQSPSATEDATDEVSESPSGESTEEPTEDGTEEPAEDAAVPNPSGSDLWVEEVAGTGELDYAWTAIPGRWVMLVATDGTAPAPQVELTWDREVETPFVRPGIILGSVLFVIGLGLLILQLLVDIEKRRSRRAAAAAAATPETAPVIVAEGDRPLTRREIRLAEEARRRGRPVKDDQPADGETELIPAVETESAPSAATPAEPAGDEAGELDAWVRSGSASPLLHEGERTTPDDLDVPEASDDQPKAAEQEAAPSSEDEEAARTPWWRRRRAVEPSEPVVVSEEGADERPAEPAATGDTDEIPAVADTDDENDPQAWGASWRQTWGLGSADDSTENQEGDR